MANLRTLIESLQGDRGESPIFYDETVDSILNPGRVRQRGPHRIPQGRIKVYELEDNELDDDIRILNSGDLANLAQYVSQVSDPSREGNMVLTLSEPSDIARLTSMLRAHMGGLITEADINNLEAQLPEHYRLDSIGQNDSADIPPVLVDIYPLFEEIVARFQVRLHTQRTVMDAENNVHAARLELKSFLEQGLSTRCRRGRINKEECQNQREQLRLTNALEDATDEYQETLEDEYKRLSEELNWLPLISQFYDEQAARDATFSVASSIATAVVGIFIPLTVEDLAIEAAVLAATLGAGKIATVTAKTGKAIRKIFRIADDLSDLKSLRITRRSKDAARRIRTTRYSQFAPYDNIMRNDDILRQMGGGACSFAGNTLVKTLGGFKPINTIDAANDYVWAKDEVTGHSGYKPVKERYSNTYADTVHITIRDIETGQRQTLTSNRIHPFFAQLPHDNPPVAVGAEGNVYQGSIERGAWVDAEHLQAGYLLLNDDDTWAEVEQVEVLPVELEAFNLNVADYHTYFVAANDDVAPVWVHNVCKLWDDAALKSLDDLLADPDVYKRVATNPQLLDGWKRVFDDFAAHGGEFGKYWDEALTRGNISWDDMHDFASANNWKNPHADPSQPWTSTLWPPKDGFAVVNGVVQRKVTTVSGGQGKHLDRYLRKEVDPFEDTGRYLADDGVSYTSRALPPGTAERSQLVRYEVMGDIKFEAGPIAPWFDEVGGSTQYFVVGPGGTKRTVQDLIDDGLLRVILPKPNVAQLSSGKLLASSINELPDGYRFVTNNGRKYIRRVDASNPDTPRLMIGQDGYVKKYTAPERLSSSADFKNNLEAVYGPMPPGHQRHHIVPDNIVKNSELYKEAMERGLYNVDRADNGIYLAGDADSFTDISRAYPTHNGSHLQYDIAVRNKLSAFTEDIDIKVLTDDEIEYLVDRVESAAIEILENWGNNRLN